MVINTNIPLQEYLHSGIIWHGSFHKTIGKEGTLLIGHGIRRAMIGHLISENAAMGIARLDVTGDSAEELSGVILFFS